MHNDVDAVAVRPNTKDLPSKNRIWGFRTPARARIRKAAAQAAESRRENRPTPTNIASGIRYFLLTDQVGTLRAVADSTGTIVKRVDYDSFGNIIADSNPEFSVPFGFAGGLHDRDTGLVRFGYRDYSPELGRFVAKDPIDFAGGDTNLYAYTMSDPVNYIDPEGLAQMVVRVPSQDDLFGNLHLDWLPEWAKNILYGFYLDPEPTAGVIIGGCGKPISPTVKFSTRKRALEAAINETTKGKTPILHPATELQPRHFHAVDSQGNLRPKHFDFP